MGIPSWIDDFPAMRMHWIAQNKVLTAIRELHKPIEIGVDYGDNYGALGCPVCNELYPCATIRALQGDEA